MDSGVKLATVKIHLMLPKGETRGRRKEESGKIVTGNFLGLVEKPCHGVLETQPIPSRVNKKKFNTKIYSKIAEQYR